MNGFQESKSEVSARISELEALLRDHAEITPEMRSSVQKRIAQLIEIRESAIQDIHVSVMESHKAICLAKNMGENEAYGNNPALYYTLAIAGECGEMANSIVKNCRNGYNPDSVLESIKSELPDVVIYSYILAYVMGIDLADLVSSKCKTVVNRAESGYYGGPLR